MSDAPEQDDRTEEPSAKKLEDAINRGDVAKSTEINTFFVLGAFTLSLVIGTGTGARTLAFDLRSFLSQAHLVQSDPATLLALGRAALLAGFGVLAIPVGLILIAAIAGAAVQHRPIWTFEPLAPKWSRLSPMGGLKRIFGREAFVQFLKGLVKISIVGIAVAVVLWGEKDRLDGFARIEPVAVLPATLALVLKLMTAVLAIYAFVAGADLLYQRLSWMKRQRMSRRELQDEHKQSEGSPEVKGRLRQLRAARVKKRMMAAVPKATVIVTNPTHYAVALHYESGMGAPVCVAKGVDGLALRIRTVAAEHGIPVIENPPLARTLHATVQIDAEIPVEHYKAVAEVIGYVLRLRRRPA